MNNNLNDIEANNEYYNLFKSRVNLEKSLNIDSIENFLSNMADLHNAIGQSYTQISTIIGMLLMKFIKDDNAAPGSSSSLLLGESCHQCKEYSKKIKELDASSAQLTTENTELKKKLDELVTLPQRVDIAVQTEAIDNAHAAVATDMANTGLDRDNRGEESSLDDIAPNLLEPNDQFPAFKPIPQQQQRSPPQSAPQQQQQHEENRSNKQKPYQKRPVEGKKNPEESHEVLEYLDDCVYSKTYKKPKLNPSNQAIHNPASNLIINLDDLPTQPNLDQLIDLEHIHPITHHQEEQQDQQMLQSHQSWQESHSKPSPLHPFPHDKDPNLKSLISAFIGSSPSISTIENPISNTANDIEWLNTSAEKAAVSKAKAKEAIADVMIIGGKNGDDNKGSSGGGDGSGNSKPTMLSREPMVTTTTTTKHFKKLSHFKLTQSQIANEEITLGNQEKKAKSGKGLATVDGAFGGGSNMDKVGIKGGSDGTSGGDGGGGTLANSSKGTKATVKANDLGPKANDQGAKANDLGAKSTDLIAVSNDPDFQGKKPSRPSSNKKGDTNLFYWGISKKYESPKDPVLLIPTNKELSLLSSPRKHQQETKQHQNEQSKQQHKRQSKQHQKDQKEQSKPQQEQQIGVMVRGSHRKKSEREGLSGYQCDQCEKFYKAISDGKIIERNKTCDRCSRHRDIYPLPSTPEHLHVDFTLESEK